MTDVLVNLIFTSPFTLILVDLLHFQKEGGKGNTCFDVADSLQNSCLSPLKLLACKAKTAQNENNNLYWKKKKNVISLRKTENTGIGKKKKKKKRQLIVVLFFVMKWHKHS